MLTVALTLALAAGPPAPTVARGQAPLEGRSPPTSSQPPDQRRAQWQERDRLLLDGTVVLALLTTLGAAAMVTGVVFFATAPDDPEHCGGIEAPPCAGQQRRLMGRITLIPGAVVAVPSAVGLGFVAHRWKEHRARRPVATARLGPAGLTLRF